MTGSDSPELGMGRVMSLRVAPRAGATRLAIKMPALQCRKFRRFSICALRGTGLEQSSLSGLLRLGADLVSVGGKAGTGFCEQVETGDVVLTQLRRLFVKADDRGDQSLVTHFPQRFAY